MSVAGRWQWRWPTAGEALACLAAFLPIAWLLTLHFQELVRSPLGLGLGLALAGYLLRRSPWDAALLGLLPTLGNTVEVGLGATLMTAAAAGLFALTRRPRFAAVAAGLLLGLLLLGIWFKQRFAGGMLTWHDLQFFFLRFADNVGVMASQPTLLAYGVAVFAAVGALGWLGWLLDRKSRRVASPAGQACAALVGLVMAGWSVHLVRGDIAVLGRENAWTLGVLGEYERPLSGFLASAGRPPQWTPAVADTAAFRERVRQRVAGASGVARPADIVLFLQESQFNPATIEGCPAALCQLDVFGAGADTTSHGPLQVSIFGGGTWLSEFALQTGVPHTAFGPGGDFAPFTVAPGIRRSFARSLKAAGYRTVAIYPVRGGMMNARLAYGAYGFDRFLDSDDVGLSGSYYTTDEDMHAAARRVLAQERRHGEPVFLMVVTIFNHGEHGARMDRVPPMLLGQAAAAFKDKPVAINVADYVWRTREFAQAVQATRPAVLEAGRPAVLGWFGDHQPPFGNALALRDMIRSVPTATGTVPARVQTWYHVASNVPHLPPAAALRSLDLVFLPGLLAQASGARLDDWLAANVVAREECAGLLQPCLRAGKANAYLSYLHNDLGAFVLP